MRKIRMLPKADADFVRIYEHYAYDRSVPDVAARIDLEIRNTIESFFDRISGHWATIES